MSRVVCALLVLLLPPPLFAQETREGAPPTALLGHELIQPREDVPPEDLDIHAAYREAQRLEAEIVQMVREIRAAELTMVQRQTLARSLESVLMPLSERAEVDAEILTAKATSAEAVERFQEELAIVMRETDAIVSNARDLLASLLDEPEPPTAEREKAEPDQEEQTEEAGLQEEARTGQHHQELPHEQPAEDQARAKASDAREKQSQAERERQKKKAAEALEMTGLHLEKALTEIQAARAKVSEEKKAAQESPEAANQPEKSKTEPPQAPTEAEATVRATEKLGQLRDLERKIDAAEEAVEAVVEKVKSMEEVSNVEIKKAEATLDAMRKAMASVEQADAAAHAAAGASTREKTREAVRAMNAASLSMESAVEAMKSMQSSNNSGAGGGRNRDNDIAQMQVLGELAEAGSGTWLDLTAQMRGKDLDIKPGETPPNARPQLWAGIEELEQAPSARKFSANTPRNVWVYIGDWHVLARYDNVGRTNIEKVYPPESIVDLSAQYLSEDGRTLRWEYESYLPPMVAPHAWESWKIYYFHTELIFEQETEAWLAIGSDDRSDLWINDLPVWHSANRHKGWYPAEGFRKVVFREGRNKVLLRLENGQAGLGFSLFLNLMQ